MVISKNRLTTLGKFIALVLRHQPEAANLTLDGEGWAPVDKLLVNKSQPMSMAELEEVVRTDNKGRYALNEDKTKIRAVQGHSVKVEAGEKPIIPPRHLYHGTSTANLNSIFRTGLQPRSRQFVHLTDSLETAKTVGLRHCKTKDDLVILRIESDEMWTAGYGFFVAENGVYLTKEVPANYLDDLSDVEN